MCQNLFFNKVVGLRPATLLKKDSGTGVFLEFCEICKKTFSYRTPLVAASFISVIAKVIAITVDSVIIRENASQKRTYSRIFYAL